MATSPRSSYKAVGSAPEALLALLASLQAGQGPAALRVCIADHVNHLIDSELLQPFCRKHFRTLCVPSGGRAGRCLSAFAVCLSGCPSVLVHSVCPSAYVQACSADWPTTLHVVQDGRAEPGGARWSTGVGAARAASVDLN